LPFDENTIMKFMEDKKLSDIPGVGSVKEQTLNGLGIMTCKDVQNHLEEIYLNFSETFYEFIVKASLGISRNRHDEKLEDELKKKSLSFAKTFRGQLISRFE
jgi:nucleotidyltransferase/DNA polymerase involved in DNA repair